MEPGWIFMRVYEAFIFASGISAGAQAVMAFKNAVTETDFAAGAAVIGVTFLFDNY